MSHGRGSALLDGFARLERFLDESEASATGTELRRMLERVRADVHRHQLNYSDCRDYHDKRLSELTAGASVSELTESAIESDSVEKVSTAHAAVEHLLWIGVCDSLARAGTERLQAALEHAEAMFKHSLERCLGGWRDAAGLVQLDAIEWLMQSEFSDVDPRDTSSLALTERSQRVQDLYLKAIEVFRHLSHGPRVRQLQCSIRCNRARVLYLTGNYETANTELSRAHAFGARGVEPDDGQTCLARYHLHRAEYCLLRARSLANGHAQVDALAKLRDRAWLLDVAATALNDAQSYLQQQRRDITTWTWLFLLQAWRNHDVVGRVDRASDAGSSSVGTTAVSPGARSHLSSRIASHRRWLAQHLK